LRCRLAAKGVLQPFSPVVPAARRAHAAAAVVAQHDVIGAEHRLLEKRRDREQLAGVRHDVEDIAVEEELRRGARPEQVAHLAGPGGEGGIRHVYFCAWCSVSRADGVRHEDHEATKNTKKIPVVFPVCRTCEHPIAPS
jgi:hypothetical protein